MKEYRKQQRKERGKQKALERQSNKILKRDEILQAADIQVLLVSVPEWGGDVYVKGMTGAERDKFEASIVEQRGKAQTMNMANIRAKLASLLALCQ